MLKRIPLSFCLLFGVLVAGVPAKAAMTMAATASPTQAIAKVGIADLLKLAVEPTPAASTLTLKDLPPGFTELPPEISAALSSRLDVLSQQIGPGNLKPENFFAFVNPQDFQIVLGFTSNIPNQPEQASFDASMQQLSKPEVQQRMLSQLQEGVKKLGEIKVTDYRTLSGLNNLANASAGITLGLEMRGQPLRVDCATFRRNSTGAFTAVMYPSDTKPKIAVAEVAQKLDGRIVQLPTDAPSPSTNVPK